MRPKHLAGDSPDVLLTTLLDRLLALHWMRGVTTEKAAKLLGMRREDFEELSDLRQCVFILQREALRRYVGAFHYAFPECDPRAVRREPTDYWRLRSFTDDELLSAPVRTENKRPIDKIEVGNRDRPPAHLPLALPRDTGQQLFEAA